MSQQYIPVPFLYVRFITLNSFFVFVCQTQISFCMYIIVYYINDYIYQAFTCISVYTEKLHDYNNYYTRSVWALWCLIVVPQVAVVVATLSGWWRTAALQYTDREYTTLPSSGDKSWPLNGGRDTGFFHQSICYWRSVREPWERGNSLLYRGERGRNREAREVCSWTFWGRWQTEPRSVKDTWPTHFILDEVCSQVCVIRSTERQVRLG